ncbi:hypothetical protein [Ruminococcus sp.]
MILLAKSLPIYYNVKQVITEVSFFIVRGFSGKLMKSLLTLSVRRSSL